MFNSNIWPNTASLWDISFQNLNDNDIDLSSSLRSPISYHWAQITKIESALNDLKMTLNATRPKVPHICWTTIRESQISLCFAPRVITHFPDNWGFWFLHKQWWNWNFRKKNRWKLEIRNFKNSQCTFLRTIGRKIHDKFENFWLRFVQGVAFWNFHSHIRKKERKKERNIYWSTGTSV